MFPRLVGSAIVLVICASVSSLIGPGFAFQQAPGTYRASLELVTIDVQLTSKTGGPVRSMTPADFDIRISGRKRAPASATFLHHDEGTVTRENLLRAGSRDECAFGFHRKVDRPTDHYLLTVDRTDADRQQVKDVKVTVIDKTIEVHTFAWRSPIRKVAQSVSAIEAFETVTVAQR